MVYCTLAQTGEYGKWQAIGQGVFVESHDRALVEQVGREQGCTSYNVPQPLELEPELCPQPPFLDRLTKGQRYCKDANTIAVWNQVDCRYDEGTCEGGCDDGYCTVAPSVPQPQPIDNNLCPRGERFLASGWELLVGCPEGYTRPQFGDYCVCDTSPQGIGTGEYKEDNSLQGIIKMLPQLLIVMVVISIIGAFKK